jgi:hypothetical protein
MQGFKILEREEFPAKGLGKRARLGFEKVPVKVKVSKVYGHHGCALP